MDTATGKDFPVEMHWEIYMCQEIIILYRCEAISQLFSLSGALHLFLFDLCQDMNCLESQRSSTIRATINLCVKTWQRKAAGARLKKKNKARSLSALELWSPHFLQ